MKEKVFISWSGKLSQKIGEEFCNWLPSVLQTISTYFTPNDVEKGSKWNSEISKQLEESIIGIICLTKENLEKPWIMFEAGALSKQLEISKVCTVLFGISNSDLKGPLTQFQSTPFSKEEIRKLLHSINKSSKDNILDDKILDSAFEMCWPNFEQRIISLLETDDSQEQLPQRPEKETLAEILQIVRAIFSNDSDQKGTKDTAFSKEYFQLVKEHIELQKELIELRTKHAKLQDNHIGALQFLTFVKSTDKETILSLIQNTKISEITKPNKWINSDTKS